LIGRHTGATQAFLRHRDAEIGGAPRRQRAAKFSNRRSYCSRKIDVFHELMMFDSVDQKW
jgi:hypothetical protein